VCAILFVCLFSEGCKSGSSEAVAAANQYYDKLGTHCDDRYLTHAEDGSLFMLAISPRLAEYDGSSVGVIENGLSDADKLNGIEWQGMMYMHAKTLREWSGNGWGLYVEVSHSQQTAIPMMKSKGTWYYRGLSGSNLTLNQVPYPPQIDCAKYAK
jgi:hypothetical protein